MRFWNIKNSFTIAWRIQCYDGYMRVEIDQSGKIGDTKIATVLAFSNGESFSIYLPATDKRKLIRVLRTPENSRVIYFQMFAALVYLLIKDFIYKCAIIYIDIEYEGREDQIKVYLLNIFKKFSQAINPDLISFMHIGKKSGAHIKALEAFRDKSKAGRIITVEEVLGIFPPTKKDRGSR